MTGLQYAAIIGAVALGTMLTRFLPFLAFGREKPAPKYVQYLGKALPGAALGLLVIYCVRNVDVTAGDHGIPQGILMLAAMLITAGLHIWRKNMLLSIAVGTVAYILMINFIH